MNDGKATTPDDRLDVLEAEIRLLDQALTALLLQRSEVARADRFELIDDRGTVLATLGPDVLSGGGSLSLRTPDGRELVLLGMSDDVGGSMLVRAWDNPDACAGVDGVSGPFDLLGALAR